MGWIPICERIEHADSVKALLRSEGRKSGHRSTRQFVIVMAATVLAAVTTSANATMHGHRLGSCIDCTVHRRAPPAGHKNITYTRKARKANNEAHAEADYYGRRIERRRRARADASDSRVGPR